ncbi:MAG: LytTR family transcriptional regulator, partial [Flavobacteriales bacterium]|nr:LytTR family transcriptional regulator [Flavobacteriales bacterium]
ALVEFERFPPFYKTWWFQISLPIVLILVFVLFFKFKILSYNKLIIQEIIKRIMGKLGTRKYLIISSDREQIRIDEDEINYIVSSKEYVYIVTDRMKQIHRSSMKEMMERLGSVKYMQVHRSYIVRKDKIDSISTHQLRIKDDIIPIGKTYVPVLKEYKSQFKNLNN